MLRQCLSTVGRIPAVKPVLRRLLRTSYTCGVRYMWTREDLPWLLNAMSLTGKGAEIGVAEGVFSEELLTIWKGRCLYSIDPWRCYSQEEYPDVMNVAQKEQDLRCERTRERLKRFGQRSQIMRMTSGDAASVIPDNSLDFAYIDAQHHYEAVKEDLGLWLPKVRKGGILAGHDYVDGQMETGLFGVKSAVDEFMREKGMRVHTTHEMSWRSWYVFVI